MAQIQQEPWLGPDSFREMAALALDGGLASCPSCVEFYYFQSETSSRLFLDSCAETGLVERVSLLDLKAVADSDSGTARSWYNQFIYISAPRFRKLNLDLARQKIENTANAVYDAFYIYYELLAANDAAIGAAYAKAVDKCQLRNSAVAERRRGVDLSSVAELRLILDGFKSAERSLNKKRPDAEKLSGAEMEKLATEQTVAFVLKTGSEGYRSARETETSNRGDELERFITDFVVDPFALKQFSRAPNRELPEGFHVQLLSLIGELCRHRYEMLAPDPARKFIEDVSSAVTEAQFKWAEDPDYVAALNDLREDLNPGLTPAVAFTKATLPPNALQSTSF